MEREKLHMRPVDAVADAMMVAVVKQIGMEIAIYKRSGRLDGDFEGLLEKGTASGCRFGSAHVLIYLREKYADLFKNMLMIETNAEHEFTLVCPWSWHDYFLVQGVDDVWYAGSPANYGREGVERTTNLIRDKSLDVVLSSINSVEGGFWPSSSRIYEEIEKEENLTTVKVDKDSGEVDYLCIYYQDDEVKAKRYLMRF